MSRSDDALLGEGANRQLTCPDGLHFTEADELDTICGQAKFGGYRTADAAQQLLTMA